MMTKGNDRLINENLLRVFRELSIKKLFSCITVNLIIRMCELMLELQQSFRELPRYQVLKR